MQKFILKILKFSLLLITTFCMIVASSYGLYELEKHKTYKKDYNKHILLLGDSNMQCAINDSIFESSLNKASSADPYFYSYLKLKEYMISSSKIDTVFLSFAPHNIFDNGWLLDDSHINSRFEDYYLSMGWADFNFLFLRNPRAVLSSFPSIVVRSLKNGIKKILGQSLFELPGSFSSLDRNILDEVKLKLENGEQLPFFRIPENLNLSQGEIIYLVKIIDLCKKKKIKLYLINLPKRNELLSFSKYGINKFYAIYDKKYSDVDFLDFSRLELSEDNYGDFVHLNKKGSTNFSSFLQKNKIDELWRIYGRNKVQMHKNVSYEKD